MAVGAQQGGRFIGHDTVRTAAVGNDRLVRGQFAQLRQQVGRRNGPCAGYVPTAVLELGTNVDHDHEGHRLVALYAADLGIGLRLDEAMGLR